jgi:hypothetical protein
MTKEQILALPQGVLLRLTNAGGLSQSTVDNWKDTRFAVKRNDLGDPQFTMNGRAVFLVIKSSPPPGYEVGYSVSCEPEHLTPIGPGYMAPQVQVS